MESSGIHGILEVMKPLDACLHLPLMNKAISRQGTSLPFVLIKEGRCKFETKVRNAQAAGFSAAIIYNNEHGTNLYKMSGNSECITAHTVFISKAAGELLPNYNKDENLECEITPAIKRSELSGWSGLLFFSISLLFMCVIIFVVDRLQHMRNIMSFKELKALPSLIFTSPPDGTSKTCAVCLEDYIAGEKLRLLPGFHQVCIDTWFTKWRSFCPM